MKKQFESYGSGIFQVNIVACVAGTYRCVWVFLFSNLASILGWHGVTYGIPEAGEVLTLC